MSIEDTKPIDPFVRMERCQELLASYNEGWERATQMAAKHFEAELTDLARLRKIESDCKAAGFVTAAGEVRKVLGTLPLTADGMVAGMKCELWADFAPAGIDAPAQCTGPGWPCVPMSRLYGSREAADQARRQNNATLAGTAAGGAQ